MESLPPRTVTRLYPKKTKQRRLLRAVLAAFALLVPALTPTAGQAQEALSLLVFDRPPYYQLQHGQPSGGFLLTTALTVFAQAGIPAILCGPGSIEQAHKADEYVELEQLALCDRFLRQLVATL